MQIQALNAVKNITIMTVMNLLFNVRKKEVINFDKRNIYGEGYEAEIKRMGWLKYSQKDQDVKAKKEFLEVKIEEIYKY